MRTPRDVATVLLQRLPGAVASASLRDLQRRLLAAQAKVPEGAAPQGAPRLIALRIAKLNRMVVAGSQPVFQNESSNAKRVQVIRYFAPFVIHRQRAVTASGTNHNRCRAARGRIARHVDRESRLVPVFIAHCARSAAFPERDGGGVEDH